MNSFKLPCGGIAHFDWASKCAHRCSSCNAVVGSIGMPRECKTLMDMDKLAEKLKGNKNGR